VRALSRTLIPLLTTPTVLHPRHKLVYFSKAGWEAAWIQTAREIVRDEFDRSYPPKSDQGEVGEVAEAPRRKVRQFLTINSCSQQNSCAQQNSSNIFDNLPALTAPLTAELSDELDRYLGTNPEHTDDALAWWAEHRKTYPRLSRMALNYLSIPGMSCVCHIWRHY
jgi:hAT family C-terminal dimerisation region